MKFIYRSYNLYLSPDREFTKRLKGLIGFVPVNLKIYKLAFSHKSSYLEASTPRKNNERLEYLGDAVLGAIVAEYLFKKYPNGDEGFLTKMRSKIVKRKSLNRIADHMGLDVFLLQQSSQRLSKSMLGNAFEALIGAIYLECGYQLTKQYVITKILRPYLDIEALEIYDDNFKSQLLEWCQKNNKTITYKLVSKYKLEKRDRFKVAVLVNGQKMATADDFNKKSAEQSASALALDSLGLLDDNHNNGNHQP